MSHPDWVAFVLPFFARMPWCVARDLKGEAAYVEALSAWNRESHTLQDRLPVPMIRLLDPSRDWAASERELVDRVVSSLAAFESE
ncbi:MAG: hypothetical protein AB8I08_16785 [Sandaracinaceae bacterium]